VSVFLGPTLTTQLSQTSVASREDSLETVRITPSLPDLELDDSDRNRTSPFAFTGNKFEFRMLGSNQSVANINTILNTILADSFAAFTDRLEHADDVIKEKKRIVKQTLEHHGRVIFNGNNYSREWEIEAKKRGLPVITNSVDAYEALAAPKNLELFEKFGVLSREECHSRREVLLEGYVKTVEIEAKTLIQLIQRFILPGIDAEVQRRAKTVRSMGKTAVTSKTLTDALETFVGLHAQIATGLAGLQAALDGWDTAVGVKEQAVYMRDTVLPAMEKVRVPTDAAEALTPPANWPLPSYYDLFYSI
jgi:glutamine synthetase